MKKTLITLGLVAMSSSAFALEMGAEVFGAYRGPTSYDATHAKGEKGYYSASGIDVTRFRVTANHKFNDAWSFAGAFEMMASDSAANKIYIRDAHFAGMGVAMENDTLKFGAQKTPVFIMESALGTEWISNFLSQDTFFNTTTFATTSKFFADYTQTGLSYGMNFGSFGVTLFSLSDESADAVDTTDNNQLNGAMLSFKAGDETTVWLQSATTNDSSVASTTGNTVTSAGANYLTEAMNLGFSYHSRQYTVASGTTPKPLTAMGLTGHFKKLIGNANLYVHYRTGYDKYEDTTEINESKMMIGPDWNLSDKMNFGIFYDAATYQSAYKTVANADASAPYLPTKDPANIWIKMAAQF